MTWQHALTLACGIAMIVLGFVGWHVEVASIVLGLILVGALSGERLADLITRRKEEHRENTG